MVGSILRVIDEPRIIIIACFFQDSDDKAEILRLTTKLEEVESAKNKLDTKIAELEEEKGNLLLSLLDNDELKGSYHLLPQYPLTLAGASHRNAAKPSSLLLLSFSLEI